MNKRYKKLRTGQLVTHYTGINGAMINFYKVDLFYSAGVGEFHSLEYTFHAHMN